MKELVEKASVVNLYPIYKLPLGGAWFKGRCLLLGDAAHAMQPHAGQGISMALEDTFLLSRLLEDEIRSLDDVFEKFEKIRRPRVAEIANLAARNAQVRKRSGPWGLWFKEFGIWMYLWVSWALGSEQKLLMYDVDREEI
ncbi:Salicylate 1-monooxygenase [Hyphodiscus hymeniophilus]|uniref:Salicylate 1-monooxygenase n=1 Tax=Hyphodiscus hymeniophilus TaxID=353542 RepID=A0A9P6VND4_9HELO|nr:Salicylate 1-monooxygenase [Hyphodiscus hymeniophilus]